MRVVGRCVRADSATIALRDAFTMVAATWTKPPSALPPPLSMVVIDATVRGGALIDASVVSARACEVTPKETTRLVDRGLAARLQGRADVVAAVRGFFTERRYLEVETPAIVPSPGLDLHLDAFEVGPTAAPAYLVTSPEYQMKRLLAGGLDRIVQLARCFRRAEEGTRHNPEFTMVEWYRAGATMDELMDETEDLMRSITARFSPAETPILSQPCDLGAPFVRMTVADAFERFAATPQDRMLELATDDEEQFFRLLVERVEPAIAAVGVPVFLTGYPATQASLARLDPRDPRYAERFELYVADLELCNGFGELVDPAEQRRRLERDQRARADAGLPIYPIDEAFLGALGEGLPPCAGNALGLDRLVALCLGARSVPDVMAFPREAL